MTMDTRMSNINRSHERGSASSTVILTIVILLAIAAAGWFLVIEPHMKVTESLVQPAAHVSKAKGAKTPAPTNVSSMTTEQLLAEASKAVKEERLLAPAGDNAFEFYLKVLERKPDDQVAKEALRETFPFGANEAEQDINARNFSEAQREIDLLAKADPENYTLTILRSKLDAQRKTATKQQQEAQAQLLAKQQAAQRAAIAAATRKQKAADAAAAAAASEAVAKTSSPSPPASGAATRKQVSKSSKPAPEPQQPNIQNAVLVSKVEPRYPMSAYRQHEQGWVEVQFTVDTSGNVTNVQAVDANPKHVFERAATDAVKRWKYRPALNDGKPFSVTMRRRIVFKMGQS
jgi:protein TonB